MPSHKKKRKRNKKRKEKVNVKDSKWQRKKFRREHIESKQKTIWKPVNTKVPGLRHEAAIKTLLCPNGKLWTYPNEYFVLTKEPLAFSINKKGNPTAEERGSAKHLMVAIKDENTGKYRPLHYMNVVWKNSVGKYKCCGASFVSDDSSGIMSVGSILAAPLEVRDSESHNKNELLLQWLNETRKDRGPLKFARIMKHYFVNFSCESSI